MPVEGYVGQQMLSHKTALVASNRGFVLAGGPCSLTDPFAFIQRFTNQEEACAISWRAMIRSRRVEAYSNFYQQTVSKILTIINSYDALFFTN